LDYPAGLAFNADGELFVAEDYNGRILKISADGESWEVFFEGLDGPGDMVLDESENIYVGEDIWEDGRPVGVIDIITPNKNKSIFANLTDPDGISFDPAGNLYVGQSYIAEVTKVMPDGSSMPAVIPDGMPWGTGVNKFEELLVVLPWAGQILKIHLSHESDISGKVNIAIPVPTNNAPVLGGIGNKTVNEGELLQFTVTAADPDGDNLAYSANNLPSGATFDPATQVFTWVPDYAQAGVYPNVQFTVTDDGDPSLSDAETISMMVENVNRHPVLETIGDKTVNEGDLLQFTLTASDPDADTLAYSVSNLPPGAMFDSATQVFGWTPGYSQANLYLDIVFTVTDNGNSPLNASESISITVEDVNRSPVLVEPIGDQSVNEGETLSFSVTATDPDGDSLTYSASNLPPGATFDLVPQIFTWTPEQGQAGSYTAILFTVTDDGDPPLSDSVMITITVIDVNENQPPVLDPIGNQSINEGETLSFTATASDPDGDTLTYSVSNLPPGAMFDPATQVFSWTPGYNQANLYPDVVFTVTDNGESSLNDSETVTITVEDVNRPPVLDLIGNKSVNEGEILSFTVTASDPDGDGLTYSVANLPSGAAFDLATQVFTWIPDYDQAGTYPDVLCMVTDNGNPSLSDSEAITITVQDSPPPVDITIDNSDPGFQLIGSEAWDSRPNPPWPSYGNDFRFNFTGSGADQAVYTFDIPVSGEYTVYAWWPSHSICSQGTPYIIPFSEGTVTIRTNQQQNPGQWNFLATGFFEQGQYQI
ncbi:MAG: hypothetical protein GY790_15085, partial [Bacteroidetes bacterium]|nr:hypothetical protein [Bacteroidota bacterium]